MWQPHRDSELLSQHRHYARGHKQKVLANCVPLAVLAYASPGTFMTLRRRLAELAAKQPPHRATEAFKRQRSLRKPRLNAIGRAQETASCNCSLCLKARPRKAYLKA